MQTAYKVVKIVNGRYLSLYDSKTEYKIGKRLAQKARPDHGGGYYAFVYDGTPDPADILGGVHLWFEENMRVAILEVELSGTIITYGNKVAATYLKPVRVLSSWTVYTMDGQWMATMNDSGVRWYSSSTATTAPFFSVYATIS
jgi:hypothetical protein